jgi:hypothetical protein
LNINKQNPWVKRRGINEIIGGDGGGRRGETGDMLGCTGIEGQDLPKSMVLFSLTEREREEMCFRGGQMKG